MNAQTINFSMNYYALKTFGKQQYSNVWAALSELVANGFDAGAKNIHLYINMIDKENSTIEIIDDGCGMDVSDLQYKYVIIGRNRRIENPNDNAVGRKGIGKLAALYLSDKYQIISVKKGETTAWEVNVSGKGDVDIPSLESINITDVHPICESIWNGTNRKNGTILRLLSVDLTRIGDRAIDALKQRLSNYFLFDSLNGTLNLCIIRKPDETVAFEQVKKQIAFDNMSHIYYSDINLVDTHQEEFTIDFTDRLRMKRTLVVKRVLEGLPCDVAETQRGNKISISGTGSFYGITKSYTLTGWVGIHSSIDNASGQQNDDRFIRNAYYNPNQIRVYVRNKLATENILQRLRLTETYVNYIEGEVSFDILDDNDMEDIATANRQDFSIVDERVRLLLEILKGLCRQLFERREELMKSLKKEQDSVDAKIQSEKKTNFAREAHQDLLSAGVPTNKADELSMVIANKLTGDFDLKTSYKIFISHSSRDRIFTDFVSNYLKFRGFCWDRDVVKTDIFYSSDGTDIMDATPLADIIKTMILDSNTDILFLTSKNFMKSQYCLFEGGAAWATRAVLEYCIIALDYDSIPDFLTNNKSEFYFSTKDRESFVLNEQNYSNVVIILNRLISHLNNNKRQAGEKEVALISNPVFDDLVQMKATGKEAKYYMDADVYQYWQTYVVEQLDSYLDNKNKQNGNSSMATIE